MSSTDVRVTWLRRSLYARGPTWVEKARDHAAEVEAASAGLADAYGYQGTPAESLANRTAASEAEVAVALYTGLRWNRVVNGFSAPDVGDDVEVKCRERRYALYLVVEADRARRDRRYVITYGRDPELYLAGWLYGDEVVELPVKVFAREDHPGHAASASALRPMDTFPEVARVVARYA